MEVEDLDYASAYPSALPPDNGRLKFSTAELPVDNCVRYLLHCSTDQQAVQHC